MPMVQSRQFKSGMISCVIRGSNNHVHAVVSNIERKFEEGIKQRKIKYVLMKKSLEKKRRGIHSYEIEAFIQAHDKMTPQKWTNVYEQKFNSIVQCDTAQKLVFFKKCIDYRDLCREFGEYGKEKSILDIPEKESIPDFLICPLSLSIMTDPVIALPSQKCYERSYIERHMQEDTRGELIFFVLTW